MSLFGFALLLLIAALAGALGQAVAGYGRGGCLASAAVGFVGAFLGLWLAGQLGLPEIFTVTIEGERFPLFWAVIGSAIFAGIVGLFTRSGRSAL